MREGVKNIVIYLQYKCVIKLNIVSKNIKGMFSDMCQKVFTSKLEIIVSTNSTSTLYIGIVNSVFRSSSHWISEL